MCVCSYVRMQNSSNIQALTFTKPIYFGCSFSGTGDGML